MSKDIIDVNGSKVFVEKGEVKTVLNEDNRKTGFMSVEDGKRITLDMRESYINYRIGVLLKEHLSKRIIINESKRPVVRLTESELHKIVATISREILNEEYKVTSTDEDFKFDNGVDAHSVLTLKDEAGGLTRVIEDDGCYVPYQRCLDGHYEAISHLYPELFNAMKKHLPNLQLQ